MHSYAVYFPSGFDPSRDSVVRESLESFGRHTGPGTSVNFWDPTDPEFSQALSFFDMQAPPALVLAAGLKSVRRGRQLDRASVYAITIANGAALRDRERLAQAVNATPEVLVRGNAEEIAAFVRAREVRSLLDTIAGIAEQSRDEVLRFKPKFQLPGGISVQLG